MDKEKKAAKKKNKILNQGMKIKARKKQLAKKQATKNKVKKKKQATKNKVKNKKQLNQFKKCLLNITYLI